MVRRVAGICAFMALFHSTVLWSADFSVSLEVSGIHYLKKNNVIIPTVFLGESFELKASIVGSKHSPNQLKISGLESFTIHSKSSHSNISVHNFDMQIEKTTGYTLLAKKLGTFRIGPATLRQNGKKISSNVVSIHVAQPSEQLRSKVVSRPQTNKSNNSSATEYELFATLEADKITAFTEEPVIVTISIYHRGNIAGIRGLRPPQFSSGTLKEIKKVKEFKTIRNGKTYGVIQKKYILFPSQPGTLSISSAQVIYTIRTNVQRDRAGFLSNQFFSSIFNSGVQQRVSSSNPLTITVTKLPPHTQAPDGIGTFSLFQATVDKTNVVVNEPIKLQLSITGQANFDLILPLKPQLPAHFKSYDSKTELKQDIEKNLAHATKTFEFIVQIPQAGPAVIPTQTFTAFDTQTKSYTTLRSNPIRLSVTMPPGGAAAYPKLPTESEAVEPPVSTTDIHFIHEDGPISATKKGAIPLVVLLLITLIIPALFYSKSIVGFISSLSQHIRTLFGGTSRRTTLSKYQNQMTKLIESQEFDSLYPFFKRFLADVFAIHPRLVNEDEIKQRLTKHQLSPKHINAFIQFLQECAQYSFASQQIRSTDAEKFAQQANSWLELIYKSIKNQG